MRPSDRRNHTPARKALAYKIWRVGRERTGRQGAEWVVLLINTGRYPTQDHLAAALRITPAQVRWRLRAAVDRGLITHAQLKERNL